MRIITLEEHVQYPDLIQQISNGKSSEVGWPNVNPVMSGTPLGAALYDVGSKRLADMDEAGVSLQILSASGAGAEVLDPAEGVVYARSYNDRLFASVRQNPDRFRAFAHLPMTAPEAAAEELEYRVREQGFCGALINGTTKGKFLDAPEFSTLLNKAEELNCPLYIHPSPPSREVQNAYYSLDDANMGFLLATSGFGWHAETAVHIMRMVLSGTFIKHPRLKVIVGHMGEFLPMLLDRADNVFRMSYQGKYGVSVSETILKHVWITTAGFFSQAAFLAALSAFGTNRIMFSVDYPYSNNVTGVDFLNHLPISADQKISIASGNAERLLGL